MPYSSPVESTETKVPRDPDHANYQNFLVWQAQHEARKRESATQFNLYQSRTRERLSSQALYKEEADQQSETLKDIVERRLCAACVCDDCDRMSRERSNSVGSLTPSSPTSSVRSSTSSLSLPISNSASPRPSYGPSSRNSLIVSPPPRSRHHKRRSQTTTS